MVYLVQVAAVLCTIPVATSPSCKYKLFWKNLQGF